MSFRVCPVCSSRCDGYKEECIGDNCGIEPCRKCVTNTSYNIGEVVQDLHVSIVWYDIDMVDDPPE